MTQTEILFKMYDADPILYEKMLDTPDFAYWFNKLTEGER